MKELNDLADFIKYRPEQYECAKDIVPLIKRIWSDPTTFCWLGCLAKVKLGKREIKKIIALLLKEAKGNTHQIYCLTKLCRKDTQSQFDDLNKCGIESYQVKSKTQINSIIHKIQDNIKNKQNIVVLIDESDYGTDVKGTLKRYFDFAKENQIPTVGFSATNFEMLFSKEEKVEKIECKIPLTYCGSKYYLDHKLAFEASPFFVGDKLLNKISQEGENLLSEFDKSNYVFSIIRTKISELDKDLLEAIIQDKYPSIHVKYINQDNSFKWGDDGDWEKLVSLNKKFPGKKWLLVIDQTATRSTEVKFHEHIYFWHDYRRGSNLATMLQAFLRVATYGQTNIKLYCFLNALKADAGYISYEKFSEERPISDRVGLNTSSQMEYKTYFISDKENLSHLPIKTVPIIEVLGQDFWELIIRILLSKDKESNLFSYLQDKSAYKNILSKFNSFSEHDKLNYLEFIQGNASDTQKINRTGQIFKIQMSDLIKVNTLNRKDNILKELLNEPPIIRSTGLITVYDVAISYGKHEVDFDKLHKKYTNLNYIIHLPDFDSFLIKVNNKNKIATKTNSVFK
jgi:hypothetical protein